MVVNLMQESPDQILQKIKNLNYGFVSVSRYDSSQSTNATKFVTRINGEQITYNYFYSSTAITNPRTGGDYHFYIGSNSGSNNFIGDVAEVIWFDRKLTDAEVTEVESYLKKKWGIDTSCKKPSSTAGYNLTACNFDNDTERRLKPSECTLSCANGYRADTFEEVTASCRLAGEEMMLHGCYADDGNFKTDEPNFIYRDNVVWWDADNGVTADENGYVTEWVSRANRDGETVATVPQHGGTEPTYSANDSTMANERTNIHNLNRSSL